MTRGPAIADVARMAGVSTATVSRAPGEGPVGPATRVGDRGPARRGSPRRLGGPRLRLRRVRSRCSRRTSPTRPSAIVGAVAVAWLAVEVSDTRRGDARMEPPRIMGMLTG